MKREERVWGFTLVELLVVITIVTILMSLLFPVLQGARETAHRAVCMANLKQLGLALDLYADSASGYNPRGYVDNSDYEQALWYEFLYQAGLMEYASGKYYRTGNLGPNTDLPLVCPSGEDCGRAGSAPTSRFGRFIHSAWLRDPIPVGGTPMADWDSRGSLNLSYTANTRMGTYRGARHADRCVRLLDLADSGGWEIKQDLCLGPCATEGTAQDNFLRHAVGRRLEDGRMHVLFHDSHVDRTVPVESWEWGGEFSDYNSGVWRPDR